MKIKFTTVLFNLNKKLLTLTMRAVIFLFCALSFAITPKEGFSQNAKVVIENDVKLSVDEVFSLIQQQTDLTFVYPSDMFVNSPEIYLKKGTIRTSILLNKSLSFGNFAYSLLQGNTIILTKNEQREKIDQATEIANAQQNISGIVFDENGDPLIGVTVLVIDEGNKSIATRGVATGLDGEYSITAKIGDVLRFSFIGYITHDIEVNTENEINVNLKLDLNNLNEIVITGYQSLSKERVTGAFSTLDQVYLEQVSSPNILDLIEGRVSGLVVTPDGEIVIRGLSNLSSSPDFNQSDRVRDQERRTRSPLVVVDGFPIEGGLNTLNAMDIASITVLKDAAAQSIWGVRASNGVIVVETKKGTGKSGEILVNFNMTLGTSMRPDLGTLNFASSRDQVEYEVENWNRIYSRSTSFPRASRSGLDLRAVDAILFEHKLGDLDGRYRALYPNRGIVYSDAEKDAALEALKQIENRDQISEYLFRPSFTQQYNLSISQSTEKSNHYLSAAYTSNKSSDVGDENRRIFLNLKNEWHFTDRISSFVNLNTTHSELRNNSVGYSGLRSYEQLLDNNGGYKHTFNSYSPYDREVYENDGYMDWSYNQIKEQRLSNDTNKSLDLRLQVGFNVKIAEGISFLSQLQYTYGTSENNRFRSQDAFDVRDAYNLYTIKDPVSGALVNQYPLGAVVNRSNGTSNAYTLRNQLNFNRRIGNNGNLVALAAMEIREYDRDLLRSNKFGYNPDTGIETLLNFKDFTSYSVETYYPRRVRRSLGIPSTISNYYDLERDVSIFGNFGYTHNEKYGVTASFRLDQSNLFGTDPKYRYNPLWSVGGQWGISDEDFFDVNFLNYLKIRSTYGYSGNVDRTVFPILVAKNTTEVYTGDPSLFIDTNNPPNNKIRPEKTSTFNVGIDLGLWDSRINANIDYYSKKSIDLITQTNLPNATGFSSTKINVGEVNNHGVELELGARIIEKNSFNWDLGLNFAYNKNEVIKSRQFNNANDYLLPYNYIEGYDAGKIFAYRYAGLADNGSPNILNVAGDTISGVSANGKIIAKLTGNDMKYMGTSTPKYTGGITNTFNYKNFTFSFDVYFKLGHVFRLPTTNITTRYISSGFGEGNVLTDVADRWREPGDENSTNVPGVTSSYTYHSKFYQQADINVADASSVRLRYITLRYELPKTMFNKTMFKNANVQFQVKNPALWTANKQGIDPDAINPYSGALRLPEPTSCSLRLNVLF